MLTPSPSPLPLPPSQEVATAPPPISPTPPSLTVGSVVNVQSRTWPGVNKPGGVARIKKVHDDTGTGIKYDVAYILGGRERMVDCGSFASGSATGKSEDGGSSSASASALAFDAKDAVDVRRKSKRASRRITRQVMVKEEKTGVIKRKLDGFKEEREEKKERGNRTKRSRTMKKESKVTTGVESGDGPTRSKKRKSVRSTATSKKDGVSTKRRRGNDEVPSTAAATKGKPQPKATKGKKSNKKSAKKKYMDGYSFTCPKCSS